MSGAPDPDGRHDDFDAGSLDGLALVIPDDARELDADRLAYLQELRRRASEPVGGRGAARVRPSGRAFGAGHRLPSALVVVVLVVLGLVGSLLSVFAPRFAAPTQPVVALASAPAAEPGMEGGLLPDATVGLNGADVALRSVRPALIALVPAGCTDCAPTVRSLFLQGRAYGLRLVLAGGASADELAALDLEAAGGGALVLEDPSGVLTDAYQPDGVTALLVHADGVVGVVVPDVTREQRLEPSLARLGRPGAAAPASSVG